MFVEKLIKENPELVKETLRELCRVDEKVKEEYRGIEGIYDRLKVDNSGYGELFINSYFSSDNWAHRMRFILKDFYISCADDISSGMVETIDCSPAVVRTEWMKFMIDQYGDQYEQALIDYREQGLKERESEYLKALEEIENYEKETQCIFDELGICQDKDEFVQ